MRLKNIAQYKTVNEYVEYKFRELRSGEQSFFALFELLFSERENTFWECNDGYRIIKKTYGEAKEEICKKAYTLQKKLGDVQKGSVVGLYMQNNLDWIECFWAILKCGHCPLLLNNRLDKNTLEDAMASVRAIAVVSDGEIFDMTTYLASDIVSDGNKNENTVFGEEILLMTSGTSSTVKICAFDAPAMINQILNTEKIVRTSPSIKKHYDGELKLLTFLPFYHIFGLTALYMWFSFYSRTFVYLKDMSSQCILNTIRRHKVTHIFAVPLFWNTVFEQAMKTVKERGEKTYAKLQKGLKISEALGGCPQFARIFRKKAFKEVRDKLFGESVFFMITGGGGISKDVLRFFNGIGYHLSNGYGMTEIGITSVELSEDSRVLNSGSIGEPFNSIEYKINEEGELLVRGNSLCKYYVENGKRIYPSGEWFYTHDLALEQDGKFFLTGRMDDLIISTSGENINPNLYELDFNLKHVKKVCLLDVKKNGQPYPILLVSVNKYISGDASEKLTAELKEKLRAFNLSSEIKEIVLTSEDLIKGNEFKINRKRLVDEYNAGTLNILANNGKKNENDEYDEIERQVAVCFNKVLGREIGKTEDFFIDAGGTSLEYFTLITYIQQEFDVVISLSGDKQLVTIEDFSAYVKESV